MGEHIKTVQHLLSKWNSDEGATDEELRSLENALLKTKEEVSETLAMRAENPTEWGISDEEIRDKVNEYMSYNGVYLPEPRIQQIVTYLARFRNDEEKLEQELKIEMSD
ncbi:hypothetical protein GLW08_04185 [Pontibacillus yanchengensis]|uniref:Uncharacterized protein n=2 Tax=Pontibacillus yanchengensis TaxID=462910 RepID=A0A6I4ZYC9_9BACI|nr:DUF1002 domain-containing protein [Pontibacillus yanchengensis]MYL35098.1 hypothetical protein [Pontibacillus yanchengensis]MYL52535.1 hypothetical protein [Pontibacillus yanchengensis]